jgi:hypothetical protein
MNHMRNWIRVPAAIGMLLMLAGCSAITDLFGGGNRNPTVTLSSPTSGAALTASEMTAEGIAQDVDGNLAAVNVYILESPTVTASTALFLANGAWTISLSLAALADGDYTLVAVATDDEAADSTADQRQFSLHRTSGGPAPTIPAGLAAEGATASTLEVSWTASEGATSYQVYRDAGSDGAFADLVYDDAATSFTDTGLAASTTYWYRVRATSAGGSSELSAAASGATTAGTTGGGGGTAPATPSGLAVGGAAWVSVDVSWDPVAGATSYQVYRDESSGGEFATLAYDGSDTSFTDYGLAMGTTYWYRIRATNDTGSSGLSATHSGATLDPPVADNLLANPSADEGTTSWTFSGPSGAATMPVSGRSVFYMESAVASSASFYQDVTLPSGSGGKWLVLAGYAWVAYTVNGSITRHPYLYAYEMNSSGGTISYLQGMIHSASGEYWQTVYGIFELDATATRIWLQPGQGYGGGDDPDGTRGVLDDLEMALFDSLAEAQAYADTYASAHPEEFEYSNIDA